jgi:hypothetical protein
VRRHLHTAYYNKNVGQENAKEELKNAFGLDPNSSNVRETKDIL